MKILALQLKRIGDLVLTAPALGEVRRLFPEAHLTLAVGEGCAGLLPAFEGIIDEALVFRRNRLNASMWKTLALTQFDVCLDFTGNDRSALCTLLSKARLRAGFEWMKNSRVRSLVYNRFVDSPVRDSHTSDHYLHLPGVLEKTGVPAAIRPALTLPAQAQTRAAALSGPGPYVVIHPGTARIEKYWVAERWAAVIGHLEGRHGLRCVITGGTDAFEREHIAKIRSAPGGQNALDLAGQGDLLTFAALIGGAAAVLSCDTAAVHLAAAFEVPQIALFGLTNPFHWRPRHGRAIVLSAARPDAPLLEFSPRMKGAPMSAISTTLLLHATDALLAGPVHSGAAPKIR